MLLNVAYGDKANTSTTDDERAKYQPDFLRSDTSDDAILVELIDTLEKIDTDAPLARLNKTTISDNNGGRIEL